MNNLIVNSITCSREEWMGILKLPRELETSVIAANVLIVPSMIPTQPKAFVEGTLHLYAYLQSQLGEGVEICITEDEYEELELNSRTVRLGRFIVKSFVLPLFLGIIGNYIYDKIREPDTVRDDDKPEYQKPVDVTFTIAVEDSTGKKKEFQYEGPASDYKVIAEEIERLWNEE